MDVCIFWVWCGILVTEVCATYTLEPKYCNSLELSYFSSNIGPHFTSYLRRQWKKKYLLYWNNLNPIALEVMFHRELEYEENGCVSLG